MENWEPDNSLIEEIEVTIEQLDAIRKAEIEKVPTEDQWYAMSPYERREWAKQATPEQRDKRQYRG